MADLYQAACAACGYRAEGLQDGAGQIGTFLEPMICQDCRELVSVVVEDLYSSSGPDLGSCPRCGGPRLLALPRLALEDQLSDEGFRLQRRAVCPRCSGELIVRPAGHWG
jgi:ribosomal protein S27AE